ncbi:hypothetical protein ACOSQ2_013272 [Xanthoceras sorbifolium]
MSIVPSCMDRYQLPSRSTHGQPPNRYSPDNSKIVKYPITNYVSTNQLPPFIKAFVNQMLVVTIPTNVQDALTDSKWAEAKTEEI